MGWKLPPDARDGRKRQEPREASCGDRASRVKAVLIMPEVVLADVSTLSADDMKSKPGKGGCYCGWVMCGDDGAGCLLLLGFV